ncbi:Asp/Glu/hydantoin racemase [Lipomyces orientalis]|uniref:Asp/Glu/hydantoin racemase n=1 Tax=Lipomyces orientalis TaxID=1233043 RepID=A0ACC3TMP6_9ASCO
MPSVLVINPNSSSSVSDTLEEVLVPPAEFSYDYFTGPPGGPLQIDSVTTEITSAANCLPAIVPLLDKYDGFLVACYSDHPLVHCLKEQTTKPVVGIFQASVLHSLALGGKFAIVTTVKIWEVLLNEAVRAFLGSETVFAGTFSTGLGVLELHDASADVVSQRIGEAALRAVQNGATVICLGCAGMAGMEEAISNAVGDKIRVVDGVVAGVEILVGLIRSGHK